MLIVTSIAAVYFACERTTKRHGPQDVVDFIEQDYRSYEQPEYVAPLLLRSRAPFLVPVGNNSIRVAYGTEYYLWFFGFVARVGEGGFTAGLEDVPKMRMGAHTSSGPYIRRATNDVGANK